MEKKIWKPMPKEKGEYKVEVLGDALPSAMTQPEEGPAKNVRIVEVIKGTTASDYIKGAIRIALVGELH